MSVEKYFKMKKSDCKDALEIYKRFLTRVTKIGEFMKLAEVRNGCNTLTSGQSSATKLTQSLLHSTDCWS